jgi:hypothetical protein
MADLSTGVEARRGVMLEAARCRSLLFDVARCVSHLDGSGEVCSNLFMKTGNFGWALGAVAIGGGVLFSACGDGETPGATAGAGASAPTGSGGAGGASANGGAGGDIGAGGFGIGGQSAGGAGGGESCAGETSKAEPIPLDMYIMLDKSGSMLDKTGMMGQGIPKWDAVTQALEAFFGDAQSAGLGVGLQYFPLRAPGVPATCTSDAQCGVAAPCVLKTCTNQGVIDPCSKSADCPAGSSCADLGQCSNDPNTYCLPVGGLCGGNKGSCVKVQTSFCLNQYTCDPGEYAKPAVEIDILNGAAPALIASIQSTTPEGATPTSAALKGGIEHAVAWAAANPTHKVVTVLATDGLPTECDPLDIPSIAQIAADGVAGAPSVLTFVIGVFAGNDMGAKADLDQIAASGGTQQAFLVDAAQDVTQQFIDALNAIRGEKLACEYLVPAPPEGETLDYFKVNVEHTPTGAGMPVTILYVSDAAGCDAMTGGWYYDADPAKGGAPTKILMCPATCTLFDQGGQIDIRIGCKTEIAPPK